MSKVIILDSAPVGLITNPIMGMRLLLPQVIKNIYLFLLMLGNGKKFRK
jgi:hypothetical protein